MGDRAAIESRAGVLVYSTGPLEQDLEVTGTIEATLYATSSAVDTDFIINLVDVHSDGLTLYISQGLVRASYREGLGERKLIEPGKIYEYRLSFRPTSFSFLKGHRIRIRGHLEPHGPPHPQPERGRLPRHHRQCGDCPADDPPQRHLVFTA
jgi:hypothetical protein